MVANRRRKLRRARLDAVMGENTGRGKKSGLSAEPLKAPVPLGPFELERPIGRGGMAEVWLGVHRAQQQKVAVKVLTGERAREEAFIRALKNEIHNVARLHHPGLILLFDTGE